MLIILFFLQNAFADAPQTLTLNQSYQLAIRKSEDVATQDENRAIASERVSQSKGALMPSIVGSALFARQDSPGAGASATASNISPETQSTIKIGAVQPLFRGLKEFAALRQSNRYLEAGELNQEQARIQLYSAVIQNFYQVLFLTKDLQNLLTEIDVNQKRLKELNDFRKIGRSRASEVLMLQANIASIDVQEEVLRNQLVVARSNFEFLTGMKGDYTLQDQDSLPTQVGALESFLAKINDRPDIRALAKTAEGVDEGTAIARAGHLPSIDLLGNYYFKRPGFLADTKWDVQLAITIPFFQGGIVQSQVRQAAALTKQSDLALAKARRLAEQEIKTLYDQIQSGFSQLSKQKVASDLSNKNYQAELRDYRFGLVSNLEVLQAMTLSQESQRMIDRIQYQLKADYLRLLAATSDRPKMQ